MEGRLLAAVEAGLAEPLARFAFTAVGSGGQRGETVVCSNGSTVITISADWLEGELAVFVSTIEATAVPLGDCIDLKSIPGLRLRRLPRDVSVGSLTSTMKKIAEAIEHQAPQLLSADA